MSQDGRNRGEESQEGGVQVREERRSSRPERTWCMNGREMDTEYYATGSLSVCAVYAASPQFVRAGLSSLSLGGTAPDSNEEVEEER